MIRIDKTGPYIIFDSVKGSNTTSVVSNGCGTNKKYTANTTCTIKLKADKGPTGTQCLLYFDAYLSGVDNLSGVNRSQDIWDHNGSTGKCKTLNWTDTDKVPCWTAEYCPSVIHNKKRYVDNLGNIGVELTIRYEITYY